MILMEAFNRKKSVTFFNSPYRALKKPLYNHFKKLT